MYEIVSVHRVDNEQFVKIFTSNLKQFFQPEAHDLSNGAGAVASVRSGARPRYGLSQRQRGGTVFHLYRSEPDFKSILLQRHARTHPKGFIAESTNPNLYWINPRCFQRRPRSVLKEYRNTDWRQQQLDLADQAVQIRIFRLTTKAKRVRPFSRKGTYTLPCNVCDLAPRSGSSQICFYVHKNSGRVPRNPL